MEFWIGMLIAAFLIWCFLRISVSIICEYNDSPKIAVKVLFLKIRILPSKKKKSKYKKLSASAYHKKIAKYKAMQAKKELKKQQKQEKKQKQKEEKKRQKKAEKQALTKADKIMKRRDLIETVRFFAKVAIKLLRIFGKRLRVKVDKMNIVVASADAATTAIMYGGITQAAAYLFKTLERVTKFKCRSEEYSITADFCSEKIKADVSMTFKIRLWHVFALGIRFGFEFVLHTISKNKRKKSEEAQTTENIITENKSENEHIKENGKV